MFNSTWPRLKSKLLCETTARNKIINIRTIYSITPGAKVGERKHQYCEEEEHCDDPAMPDTVHVYLHEGGGAHACVLHACPCMSTYQEDDQGLGRVAPLDDSL